MGSRTGQSRARRIDRTKLGRRSSTPLYRTRQRKQTGLVPKKKRVVHRSDDEFPKNIKLPKGNGGGQQDDGGQSGGGGRHLSRIRPDKDTEIVEPRPNLPQ